MPTKSTKTTTKSESKKIKSSEKKSSSKISEKKIVEKKNVEKKDVEKKSSTKKVVVKRRKTDLKPTKASAVAIVSQANRAKKKALIEKVAKSDVIPQRSEGTSNTKIPLWVWVFFGCSLLLFCVSFYQAIIRPQIEDENIMVDEASYLVDESADSGLNTQQEIDNKNDNEIVTENESLDQAQVDENQWVDVPQTATDVIEWFFDRMSDRNFDWAFDLMTSALRNYPDIRDHFSSVRMNLFLDWIEGWRLIPENIEYVWSSEYWKNVYNFDLFYVLRSNQEEYEETWEVGVNTSWNEPKISSIRCISTKCSYHPIFWPENFGLSSS